MPAKYRPTSGTNISIMLLGSPPGLSIIDTMASTNTAIRHLDRYDCDAENADPLQKQHHQRQLKADAEPKGISSTKLNHSLIRSSVLTLNARLKLKKKFSTGGKTKKNAMQAPSRNSPTLKGKNKWTYCFSCG